MQQTISQINNLTLHLTLRGLLDSSVGKESSCNAEDIGDAGSGPGSGRSPEGGNGNPLQYSCMKNPQDEELGRL